MNKIWQGVSQLLFSNRKLTKRKEGYLTMAPTRRSLKVWVPDRTAAVLDLPNSDMTAEDVRRTLVQAGHTALENAEYTETIVSDNGREIRFKRISGGTKGSF